MATVVTIMDGPSWDANTDVIVVADPGARSLLWVPRDIWSETIGRRLNRAFARGGHAVLLSALRALGIAVDHSVCVRRDASERALEGVSVVVPVRRKIVLWYPLSPRSRIEDGRMQVTFRPPTEVLSGDRIHQWIGAREPFSDLERIMRQQQFVRALMDQGFDFAAVRRDSGVSVSDALAFSELGAVDSSWRFRTFGPLSPAVLEGAEVLLPRRPDRLLRARLVARRLGTTLFPLA